MKIAMWSGPRNLSTAMMYSFAARRDTSVVDEPFYAAYLAQTGLPHPMRNEVLASQSTDAFEVERALLEPASTPHHYQKHMTQHMLPDFPLAWMGQMKNVFLIRHPARVLASWTNKHDTPDLADIGFTQQNALYDHCLDHDLTPVIVDSADVRANPRGALRALCDAIGLEWDDAMLNWPEGPKPFDGVWAAHWYDAVHRSTGFAGAEGALPSLQGDLAALNEKALPLYDRLAALKLAI